MRAFLAALFFALAGLQAVQAAETREVHVFTFDDSSCGLWMKSSQNNLIRALYVSWIQGFVSGHNYATPERQVKTGKLPAGEALSRYLDAYCKDNPSLSFVGAALALVQDLREPVAPSKAPAAKDTPAKKPIAPAK